MKCEKYLDLIDDFIEGELDPLTSQQVNLHVFACPECAAYYETLKEEKEIYARYLFDAEPSNDLWAKFQTRLESEGIENSGSAGILAGIYVWRESLFGFLRLSPALAFGALILTIGIGFVLFNFWANENAPVTVPLAENQPKTVDIENIESANSAANVGDNKNLISPKNIVAQNRFTNAESKPTTNIEIGAVKETKIKKSAVSENRNANPIEIARLTDEQLQIRTLETEAAKQVEKVELLLRSFRNAGFDEGGEAFDVAYEKEQARKLLEKNVRLRRDAETYGSFDTEEILSRVEPYLIDISNLESEPSPDKVRDIKERVKSQNIIAGLQIY